MVQSRRPTSSTTSVRSAHRVSTGTDIYLKQEPTEKAKLLKMVLSNCAVDARSVYPTYRKPFDLIFQHAKNEGWRARRDSNPQPSA